MTYDGFLDVRWPESIRPVTRALETIAHAGPVSAVEVVSSDSNLSTEKFHRYLSRELLLEDVASSRLDVAALPRLARQVLGGGR